jgi:hypothetical protein
LLQAGGITAYYSGIEGLLGAGGGLVDGKPQQQLPKNSKFISGFRGFILDSLR